MDFKTFLEEYLACYLKLSSKFTEFCSPYIEADMNP